MNSFKHSRVGVLLAAALTILVGAISVLAQTPAGGAPAPVDTFSGKYEGTAKNPDGSFMNLLLELKNEKGKVSGSASSGATTLKISEGSLEDAKLTVKFEGREGVLNAKVEADKITGEWIEGSRKLAVEFKRVAPSATTAPAAATTAFSLPGEWEAVADANGQPFPFLLVLKLDGEKVTGTSSSQLGDSNISSGSWKDGRLAFALEGPNGTVTMSATVVEGKLTGDFDFAG